MLLAFLCAPAAHAGFKSKAFTPPAGEPIKTIGLLKVGEPRGYFLGEGGGPGGATQVFGLGGLFYDQFKKPKHHEYENAGFHFSAEAERVLTAHLKAAGFNVIVVPVERKKPYQLIDDYKALSVPHVDAYLDIASGGVGYRKSTFSAFPGAARKVGPVVNIIVQLVSARSKKVLYADTLEYGWDSATVGNAGIEIDAPDDHIFKNTDALEMDLLRGTGSRSLTQLTQGIDIAMRRIVSDFSAYPATGGPLQAGTTDSSIDIAKAAPSAATPMPGAAITGWRHKPVADFQTIVGKWEGSGLTAEGKKFDLEITYQSDGSYTFRTNRGTPRSARGMRIAGGVLKGKSYTTGDPVTIALYEDEKGNRVLKGQRTDGLTWTIAKTKYALSSFLAAGGNKVRPVPMAPGTGTTPKTVPGATSPAATPSPGETIPKGRISTAYKIAIFPFDGDAYCVGTNRPSDEKFAAELGAFIKSNNALVLAYSHYDQNLNQPPIKRPSRLWKGSKPHLARVYALGEDHGVDAVVTYWRADSAPGQSQTNCSLKSPPFPIDVWVIDIQQRKVYPLKGHEERLSAMVEQAFSKFLAGRHSEQERKAYTEQSSKGR